jgi:hypothetical protein
MAISLPIVSEFDGKGVKSAIQEFKQLEGAGAKAQFALKKAAIPATAAIAGLAAGLGAATKAAIEDEQAQQQLALALQNAAGATTADVDATEEFISATALATGVADDQLRPALGNLARATGDLQRSQELLDHAMNISAATGKDLESVTIALGKAENGQYDALKKLGVPISENIQALKDLESQKKTVYKATKDLNQIEADIASGLLVGEEATNKLTKAQGKLASETDLLNQMVSNATNYTDDLTKLFGGAAAANAETMAGKMARLKVGLDEAKESIGAALIPVVEKLLAFLIPLATWAQENTTVFLVFAGVIGGLSLAVLAANAAMKIYNATLVIAKAAQAAFNFVMAANPIGLVVIALAALAAAFVVAYKKSETFREIVQTLFDAIQTGVEFSLNAIKTYLEFVLGVYKTVFNTIAKLWNNTIGKLSFKFPDWVPGLGGKGFDVPDIPMLADGGIVTKPTLAMIGEAGPEAVIPLNRGGGMGNVTINVYSTLADATLPDKIVNALRQYNRRSGVIDIQVA